MIWPFVKSRKRELIEKLAKERKQSKERHEEVAHLIQLAMEGAGKKVLK